VARLVPDLRAELARIREDGQAPWMTRAVVVYAPDEVRELTDTREPVPSLALIEAVKDEFDSEHRMAPGRIADAA
jgi:glycolate oxidase FAD binding subunit